MCFQSILCTRFARAIITDHITKCFENTTDKVAWLMELERTPATLNEHYLADYKAKFLAHYKGTRFRAAKGTLMSQIRGYNLMVPSSPVSKVITAYTEMGVKDIK